MKTIRLLLAMALLISCCFIGLVACEKEKASENDSSQQQESTAPDKNEVTGDLADIVAAVDNEISITDNVSEVIYKAQDDDELMIMLYGVVDIPAADHLIDYAVTSPSNSHHTFALFVFDDDATQEVYDEVREIVEETYMETQASSLQMYMPEEYAVMSWAIENQDLVWKQYDNALALIINGEGEATAAWDAFEAAALK